MSPAGEAPAQPALMILKARFKCDPASDPNTDLLLIDGRHQGAREPFVVFQEPRLASFTSVLDTNANHGPGGVVALDDEGLEDPQVDVQRIGRSSISVVLI